VNGIQILATQPWVERLGLTLLHFLWQGTIIVALYAAARRFGARTSGPNGRYFLACAALTAMAIAPVVTWMTLRAPAPESVAASFAAPLSAARAVPARSMSLPLPTDTGSTSPAAFLSWVVVFWLIGATALSLRLLGGWLFAVRLCSTMVRGFCRMAAGL
jgi:bla regulator protein BlaR1